MPTMMDAIQEAVKVQEAKPKRKRLTPAEKAENERRRFCDAARRMLDEVGKKNIMLDELIAKEKEREILTGVKNHADFNRHRTVLETLKLAVLETKSAFNCGD